MGWVFQWSLHSLRSHWLSVTYCCAVIFSCCSTLTYLIQFYDVITLLRVLQLKVLPRDLQLCSETASGVDAGGQHEWGELVQLDPQTVGVIVRLERETFQVVAVQSSDCILLLKEFLQLIQTTSVKHVKVCLVLYDSNPAICGPCHRYLTCTVRC